MSPEEVKEMMAKLGIPENGWSELGERSIKSPLMAGHAEALVKLRDFLDSMVANDQASLVRLREQLARAQHGGGT